MQECIPTCTRMRLGDRRSGRWDRVRRGGLCATSIRHGTGDGAVLLTHDERRGPAARSAAGRQFGLREAREDMTW